MKATDRSKHGQVEKRKAPARQTPVEATAKTAEACPSGDCQHGRPSCPVLDKALVLLLDREEAILGDIVKECQALVELANDQAMEMAEFLDNQA